MKDNIYQKKEEVKVVLFDCSEIPEHIVPLVNKKIL